jgi:hypothetical protein
MRRMDAGNSDGEALVHHRRRLQATWCEARQRAGTPRPRFLENPICDIPNWKQILPLKEKGSDAKIIQGKEVDELCERLLAEGDMFTAAFDPADPEVVSPRGQPAALCSWRARADR